MAFDKVILTNPRTGQIKEAPIGFSWTMFFWGPFAPMFRGDWKWALIIFVVAVIATIITVGMGGWVPSLVGAFVWNKSYLNRLIADGFQVKATERGTSLERIDRELGYSARRAEAA